MKNLLLIVSFLFASNLKAGPCDTLDQIYNNLTGTNFYYSSDISKYKDNIATLVLCSDQNAVTNCLNSCQSQETADKTYIGSLKLGYGLCRNLMGNCCADATPPKTYVCKSKVVVNPAKM
jgi:hypothetical protein